MYVRQNAARHGKNFLKELVLVLIVDISIEINKK